MNLGQLNCLTLDKLGVGWGSRFESLHRQSSFFEFIFHFVKFLCCKTTCTKYQASSRPTIAYSIFYQYRGMEGKFQGGVRETFSKGVRASFPEGSYKLGHAFQWDHTLKIVFPWTIFGMTRPGIQAQKQI